MICVHCGNEHEERTKFCPKTGKAIGKDSGKHAATATKLMFLPDLKLPGSSAGAALPGRAGGGQADALAGRTMIAHVLPKTPPAPAPAAPSPVLARMQHDTEANPAIPDHDALDDTDHDHDHDPDATVTAANVALAARDTLVDESDTGGDSLALPAPAAVDPDETAEAGVDAFGTTADANPAGNDRDGGAGHAAAMLPEAVAATVVQPVWRNGASGAIATSGTIVATTPPTGDPAPTVSVVAEEAIPEAVDPARDASPYDRAAAGVPQSFVTGPSGATDTAAPKRPLPEMPSGGPVPKKSIPSWAVSPDFADPGRPSAVFDSVGSGLGFVELVQQTALFYGRNVVPLLIMTAIVLGPISILTSALVAALGGGNTTVPGAATMVLGFVVSLLVMGTAWPLTMGTLTLAVLDRLHGGKIDPRRHWNFTASRVMPLVTAIVPVAFITAIGYLLFVIPGLIASLVLALVPTVVLIEGRQGADALKRSVALMKEILAPALGAMLIFVVLSLLLRKLVTTAIPGHGFFDLLASDLTFIALAPLPMIALTLLYLDLRRSQEGLTAEAFRHDLDNLGM